MRQMRRHRHRLHAAGDDDLRIAIGDLLQAEGHRAQARTAKLVHAPRRLLLRNAGRHGGLPRRILSLAAGQYLAQDHFIDFFRRDLGSFERAFDGNGPQFMGGQIEPNAPLNEPTGVRAADTITTSVMINSSFSVPCASIFKVKRRLAGARLPRSRHPQSLRTPDRPLRHRSPGSDVDGALFHRAPLPIWRRRLSQRHFL